MDVKEIVKRYLIKEKFDGLSKDNECGCTITNLMICDGACNDCEPAHRIKCEGCSSFDFCMGEKETICPHASKKAEKEMLAEK